VNAFDLSVGAARRALVSTGADDDGGTARERYATAVWCQLIEPGDSVAGRLIAARGAAPALEAVLAEGTLPEVTPRELAEGRKRWLPRLSARAVADSLATAAARGVTMVTRSDPQWPRQLDDLDAHAPVCLWVRGDVAALRRLDVSVAIVGARAASRYGDHVARSSLPNSPVAASPWCRAARTASTAPRIARRCPPAASRWRSSPEGRTGPIPSVTPS